MPDYTPHQKKIIQRYYDSKDEILLSRLQEIVTELYLADSDSKKQSLWTRAAKAMQGLRVPEATQSHLLAQQKPDLLARHLTTWLKSGTTGR